MKSSGTEAGRVLVVQDEPVISWICSQTLRGEGFKVDIAANGSIAEGMLGEKEYDLVLIDIMRGNSLSYNQIIPKRKVDQCKHTV